MSLSQRMRGGVFWLYLRRGDTSEGRSQGWSLTPTNFTTGTVPLVKASDSMQQALSTMQCAECT